MLVVSFLSYIVLFVVFLFGMGQVAWIFLDSKERGDKLGIVWAMFAVIPIIMPILLPLPIIVYLLITRSFSEKCSNCNSRVSSNFAACPNCGNELKEKCSSCEKIVKDTWNYCPYCKNKINKERK